MAINHKYTDRQARKFQITSLAYVLVIILIIAIPILLKQEKKEGKPNRETKSITQTVCTQEQLEEKYNNLLNRYTEDKKIELILNGTKDCTVTLARNIKDINEYNSLTNRIFVLVARYDSPIKNITTTDLTNILITQKYGNSTAIWDNITDSYIRTSYKDIGVGQKVVSNEETHKLILKDNKTLAIIPFEQITNTHKVIAIDNLNPLSKDFNTQRYPLIDKYWIKGDTKLEENLTERVLETIPQTNYNRNNIRTVILTGSSAVGSGVQQNLYTQKKDQYISQNIQNLIKTADIAQLNNEASLSTPCIQSPTTSKYCTTDQNLELLKDLEIDVVGANGNHIMDISSDTYINTLDWYKKNEVQYYAGGSNLEDSWTPRVVEVKGLKFSFIGFNFLYPFSYYATKTTPGSANVDMEIMKEVIESAKKVSDKVFVDMNWGFEYEKRLTPYQTEYANKAIEYGADVVFGTQSRVFQQIDIFDNGKVILYGLGSFLPHTYTNSDSAIYQLTYYGDKLINIDITPISFSNNTLELAEGSQLDTMLNKVYSNIQLR